MKRGDLTLLTEWPQDPALHGLLRDWRAVPARELRAEANAWLDRFGGGRWPGIADLFATAPFRSQSGGVQGFTPVCFAPREGLVAAGHADGRVRVWDLEAQDPVAQFSAHDAAITGLAFHPNGKILASASRDHTAKLWAVETGTRICRLAGHLDDVEAVAFHPEGGMLVTASRDGSAALWEVPSGAHLLGLVKWPPEYVASGRDVTVFPILHGCFSPDGTTLATGSSSCLVLWDLETRKETAVWRDHKGPVTAAAYARDGKRLVSGGADRTVRVWDVVRRCGLGALPLAAGTIRWLKVLDDGDTVVALIAPAALQFWSLESRRGLCTVCPVAGEIGAADVHEGEGLLCLGLASGEMRLLHFAGARTLLGEAARVFGARGEPAASARCWEALERWPAAAEQAERAGDDRTAARLWERARDFRRAGAGLLRAGIPVEAARAFARADDARAAAAAWVEAGRPEEAALLYRKLLAQANDERSATPAVAGWRLAAILSGGPDDRESHELALAARAALAQRAAHLAPDETVAALEALAVYARATGREAEAKEEFEAALRSGALSPTHQVRLLETYRRTAEAFGNAALVAELVRRCEKAKRDEAASRAAARKAQEEEAAAVAAPRQPAAQDRFTVIWHATANVKCARLLSELARRFPTEITLHVGHRQADARRGHQLAAFLTHSGVRGFEVEFRFKGDRVEEALAAFAELIHTHEVFRQE